MYFDWTIRGSSSSRRISDAKVSVGNPLSSSSASGSGEGEEWKRFEFHIHGFANLSTTKDHYVASPEFYCNEHRWELLVFPGGDDQAAEGSVSVYLHHLTPACISVVYGMKVIDKFGKPKVTKNSVIHPSNSKTHIFSCQGWANFISRSDILDESQNILDSHGMLTVVVFMEEEPKTSFVPPNPVVKIMNEMFNDVNSADVCFEGSSTDEGALSLYAHRLILEQCAPMLAAICGSNDDSGEVVTVTINDVKPDIFRHLLFYVYGGSVPEYALKTHAKDIIDAADKYSIVNLKLAAEAAYVESTDISLDNAMDNLLYADSMNLALLKEAVMNFLAENHREAAANISFSDFPGHLVKDLLIAVGSHINGNRAHVVDNMSVSALRRKLHNMGLEVDGSREVMIESIKSASRSRE